MNLALGTVQFGKEYGIANRRGKPSRDEVLRILDRAWKSGVRCFDTAPVYGNSEEILGEFLANKPAHEASVVTKLDYLDVDSPSYAAPDYHHKFLDSIQRSLNRLRLERVDALLVQQRSLIQSLDDAIVRALRSLVEKGLTRKVGFSVYNPLECGQVLKFLKPDILEVPYNVFDRRCGQYIQFNESHLDGTDIWVRSVFLQGVVFLRPSQLPEKLEPLAGSLRAFHQFRDQRALSTERIAISFVRHQDWIDTVILGVDSLDQFKSNRFAFQNPIDPSRLQEFPQNVVPEQEPYLNPDHW